MTDPIPQATECWPMSSGFPYDRFIMHSQSKPDRSPEVSDNPNPLPTPSTVNRIAPQDGNGAAPAAPGSTQTAPTVPQTISSVEDVLTWLSAIFPTVVIAVSRKRVGAAAGAKPASVQVLHAGDAGEALKLASVAAGVLQGA